MPDPAVTPVACLGKHSVQLAHAFGQVGIRGLDEQMVVVVHQAPGIAQPVELPDHLAEDAQKALPVGVVLEDVLAPVAARGDVIERVGEFDADWTRHGGQNSIGNATLLDLTPLALLLYYALLHC